YLYGTELSIRNFYRGDAQIIGFSAELLDASYLPTGEDTMSGVLDVMSQILFHPLLDADGLLDARYVESEKQLQCDSIRSQKNNPRAYAADRCRAILYRNDACGAPILGTEEEIMAITPAELTAHWRYLLSHITLDCFYVGAASPNGIAALLGKQLAPELTAARYTRNRLRPSAVVPTEETVRRDESLEVTQGHLLFGLCTGITVCDPHYYACAIYHEMLGTSPVSKLFVNVREKHSLCYHCSSTYNAYKGTVMISCGLAPKNREHAETEIMEQLRALAEGNFSEEELDAAKRSLSNAYRQIEDSPAALESFYFGRALAGVGDSVEHCRQAFLAITREDVIAVAKSIVVDTVYYLDGTLGDGEELDDEDD
ncbi:MAG: insulinase family protein, partial [Clostridia bacterium]|nr:insulinase family protein [Clostridia bacterium]